MIVFDMEMSGLDVAKNSILSIGAVDFANPNNRFYEECKIRRYAKADPDAMAVNGFTLKSIRDKKKISEEQMVNDFCKWMENVKDRTIGGHNVQFDMRFLKHAFYIYDIDFKIGSRCIDTYALVYIH